MPLPVQPLQTHQTPADLAGAAELRREKLDLELRVHQLEGEPAAWKARCQSFFGAMAAESRKPHYGHHAKAVIENMLLRAQEAGLYSPEAV